jgi:glycopeptide antibiotics resistance protein
MDLKQRRWIAASALIAYCAILIRFIVFKAIPLIHIGHLRLRFGGTQTGPANFQPFRTIWPLLNGRSNHLIAIVNLAGNIVPFMPLGFIAALIYPKMTWQKALTLAIAVGLTMEAMEVVFRVGIFDVDDIILNALGVIIGYWLFAAFARRSRRRTWNRRPDAVSR